MPVGMAHDDSVNTDISLLDEVKIQARVLIPVLRALRTELGEATANRLVRTALRDWSRQLVEELGSRLPGRPQGQVGDRPQRAVSQNRRRYRHRDAQAGAGRD